MLHGGFCACLTKQRKKENKRDDKSVKDQNIRKKKNSRMKTVLNNYHLVRVEKTSNHIHQGQGSALPVDKNKLQSN